jgi:tetratricopeptide (TPR) repeat protein
MPIHAPRTRKKSRLLLLGLSLLSGCAASGFGAQASDPTATSPYGAYLIGQFALDQNEFAIAASQLRRALAHDPTNQTLLSQAFIAAMLDGSPDALGLAQRLPQNPIAQLLLGDAAAKSGDWQQAHARFAGITTPGLAKYLAPLLVAWADAGRHDPDAAIATLQPQIGQPPLGGMYALNAALIADLSDRFPEAEKYFAMAGDGGADVSLRLARIAANWDVRQGHQRGAIATLQSLSQTAPGLAIVVPALIADVRTRPIRNAADGLAEVYLSFAATLQQQHGGETSLALLRLALDLRPDLTEARLLMSDALVVSHHPHGALRALATVANSDPLSPLVRLRRAEIEAGLGDRKSAEAGLRQLVAEMPTRSEPLAALADLQRTSNQLPAAIATYNRAIALAGPQDGNLWSLYFALGVTKQQAGDWPGSEADLRHALSLAPDQPAVLNFLGYSWADRDVHLTQAEAMLAKAAKLNPDDGAIIDSLGWVKLRQGDIPAAVKLLQRAAQMEPEDPEINGHLGDAYWAAGYKLQALYQWQLALNFKPDPNAAAKLEAKLKDAKRATESTQR